MKFKNVLIASDFDGTLKNDEGIITPDVIEKIQYFIENEVQVPSPAPKREDTLARSLRDY